MPRIGRPGFTNHGLLMGVGLAIAGLCAGALYVCALAFVPGFTACSPFVCPTSRCLGLQCPSCGMTRALACLVRCDVASALRYNPLVMLAIPFALAIAADAVLQWGGREGLGRRLPRLSRWSWRLLLAAFVVLGSVRFATWLVPSCNPDGWLMPPPQFPPAAR